MLYGGAIDTQALGDATVASANGALVTRPVMTFTSQVMAIRSIDSGETVGYGGLWTAQRNSRIATIPVGYGDGYPRTAENGTPVIIEGVRCPLVGRVSMDMITVDVTACTQATIGSPVQLWGPQLSVDEIARHANTIGYELLTRVSERVPRVVRPITTP
jgi:alanine racemase